LQIGSEWGMPALLLLCGVNPDAFAAVAERQRVDAVFVWLCVPRAIASAPATPNPRTRAPRPPSRRFRFVVVRISHEAQG
jgi:hypothetical protein